MGTVDGPRIRIRVWSSLRLVVPPGKNPQVYTTESIVDDALAWDANWAWSLPLIIITVMFHVVGLVFINEKVYRVRLYLKRRHRFLLAFAPIMGITTLWVTVLHAVEAGIWAGMYWFLGALPDGKGALLYSLGAMTTYGHASDYLAPHWQLMGTLEALNGVILFGLTTAFLFNMIREVCDRGLAEQA
jgi:hypothetical protein